MFRFFVFCCFLSLSVVNRSDEQESLLPEINDDDIDYEKLLSDPTINELFKNFKPSKNYSKFFHLDVMYGFHGNFHDFGCYWANAWKRHFSFGDKYQQWHTGLRTAMKNNRDGTSSFSYYEYFNFMQSFWKSSSFSLCPTWTWQIKNSNWFFSVGPILEWSGYNYSYDFVSSRKGDFLLLGNYEVDNAFKEGKGESIFKAAYRDRFTDKSYKIKQDLFYYTNSSYQIIKQVEVENGNYDLYLYTDFVSCSTEKKDQVDNTIKVLDSENLSPDVSKAIFWNVQKDIEYKESNGENKKEYINVIRKKNDTYDGESISHPQTGTTTYYVCGNDDEAASCYIVNNIFRIGVMANISWYKNKVDPFSSWHFGLSFSFGPQFGYDNSGNFSFGKHITKDFKNIEIRRFLNVGTPSFNERVKNEALFARPVFCFLQLEVGYNRISVWFRLYYPLFSKIASPDACKFCIVNDSDTSNVFAKYKDIIYPMTLPEQIDIGESFNKTATFNRVGFACGVKINF